MADRALESNFAGQGSLSLFKQAGKMQQEMQQGGTTPFKTMIGLGVVLVGLGICFAGLAMTLREIRKFRKPKRSTSSWTDGQQPQQQPPQPLYAPQQLYTTYVGQE